MKKLLAIICLTMGLLNAASSAPASDDLIGLTTANGKLAAKMLDLWFNEHKPGEAFDKYVSRTNFVNHTGKETSHSFDDIRTEEIKITGTNLHFDIKQIVAQGDLVFAHIHVINGHSVNGRELVEIMRFQDGKLIEHWNLHGPLDDDPDVFFGH